MATARMDVVAKGRVPTSCNVGHRQAMAVLVLVATLIMSWMSAGNAQGAADQDVLPNEGNPTAIGWYRAHGWLMWLAFGIFFPLGVFISRYGQYHFSQWFWAHVTLQVTGVILSTVAFAIANNKFQVTVWDNTHVKLGLTIMILVWLTPLLALVRPQRGSIGIRPAWYIMHWLTATTAIILGWFNIFKGLDEYVASWPSGGERKASYVLWGINVATLAFLYLFLDRLPYIRTQQSKDPGAANPKDTRSNIAMSASDLETPFDLPGTDGPTRHAQV